MLNASANRQVRFATKITISYSIIWFEGLVVYETLLNIFHFNSMVEAKCKLAAKIRGRQLLCMLT